MSIAVGIDIGGTSIRLGLVDEAGRLLHAMRTDTPRSAGAIVEWIEASLLQARAQVRARAADAYNRTAAAGVALPGLLDDRRAALVRAVNLSFLEGFALRDVLRRHLQMPVVLECDTVAAGWAEYLHLEPRPLRFAYLTIGTGVGAAVVLNGHVVRHTHHSAGHFGHLIVDPSPDAAPCPCGLHGCLESMVSGPALERAARSAGLPPSLPALQERTAADDAVAIRLVDRAARFLAIGFNNLATLYAPQVIVVGGGVVRCVPELLRRAIEGWETLRGSIVPSSMEVRTARLGDDGGVIGAAMLARGAMTPADSASS